MPLVLGIETSCDETAAALFDTSAQKIVAHDLYSQKKHFKYGGVVPEIASRSQLEKIDVIVQGTLSAAHIALEEIDVIAVTNTPGLVGSLLVGTCFAKALAWSLDKPIIGINHLEGHIFSTFLKPDGSVNPSIPFPHLSITASGGHTAMYLVHGFGDYERIAQTTDDAAGEAFDKIGKILGFGYPSGAIIERYATEFEFQDLLSYPRNKVKNQEITFSFSGLKTAVLYDLVKKGAYDLNIGPLRENMSEELKHQVSSSLLVCIGDIFFKNIERAFKRFPDIKALTFGGGVACNKYLCKRFQDFCTENGKDFFSAPPQFCTDNGAMIAFVGGYKAEQKLFSSLDFDVMKEALPLNQ